MQRKSPRTSSILKRFGIGLRLRGGKALLMGLLLALAGIALDLPSGDSPAVWMEETIGLPLLFQLRQAVMPRTPSDQVTVIEIDRDAAAEILPEGDIEPRDWPRRLHAELVDRLHDAGARLVVFDSVFRSPQVACGPGQDPSDDRLFAEAMKKANNVILAQEIDADSKNGEIVIARTVPSIDELEQAALNTAVHPMPELESRDHATRFFVFSPATGDSMTLPLVTLWHDWMRTGGNFGTCSPPPESIAGSGPEPKRERDQVSALHDWLADPPNCAQELLASGEWAGLSPATRALLRIYGDLDASTGIINHYGPSATLKTCAYLDVLKGRDARGCTAADLKDKVVFVGFAADFQPLRNREIFRTVFGRVSMVELLATTFSNLSEDETIGTLPTGIGTLWLGLWGFLVGAIVGGCRSFLSTLRTTLPLTLLCFFASVSLFVFLDFWLWWVIPVFGLSATGLLIRLGLVFRPNYKGYGTVLGSDMEGSTKAMENLFEPDRNRLKLKYTSEVTRIAQLHQGIFANCDAGDQWYGFWKSRLFSLHARRQACRSALKIAAFSESFPKQFGVEMPLRMGLHFDNFEAVRQFNLDLPNFRWPTTNVSSIASRLENANKKLHAVPRILLSRDALPESTADSQEASFVSRLFPWLQPRFITRRLGVFELQGLNPMEIHHLMGCRDDLKETDINRLDDLRGRFETALALWEEQDWEGATEAFTEILVDYPEDGPSRFYIDHLEFARASSTNIIKLSK